jgi:hypothetical protein
MWYDNVFIVMLLLIFAGLCVVSVVDRVCKCIEQRSLSRAYVAFMTGKMANINGTIKETVEECVHDMDIFKDKIVKK